MGAMQTWKVLINGNIYQTDLATLKWWISQKWVLPEDMVRTGSRNWTPVGSAPPLRGVLLGTEEVVSVGSGIAPNQMPPVAQLSAARPPAVVPPARTDKALKSHLFGLSLLLVCLGLLGLVCSGFMPYDLTAANNVYYFQTRQGQFAIILAVFSLITVVIKVPQLLWAIVIALTLLAGHSVGLDGMAFKKAPPPPPPAQYRYYPQLDRPDAQPYPPALVPAYRPAEPRRLGNNFQCAVVQGAGIFFLFLAALVSNWNPKPSLPENE